MKKRKNIEMRIYELLGVKVFKKMVLCLRDIIFIPLTRKMNKEERFDYIYKTPSNYNIGKINSLEDIIKFKKQLFLNAGIHIFGLLVCLPCFLETIYEMSPLALTIAYLSLIGLNSYCIMLQRYNYIRLKQIIKMITPRYEREKAAMKEELKEADSQLLDHTYKIVDKKARETSVSIDDLIDKADLEQLRKYRDYLNHFKGISQAVKEYNCSEHQACLSMPMAKNKSLKLELKTNNKSAIN